MPRLIMITNNQSFPSDLITYLKMVAVSRLQVIRGKIAGAIRFVQDKYIFGVLD